VGVARGDNIHYLDLLSEMDQNDQGDTGQSASAAQWKLMASSRSDKTPHCSNLSSRMTALPHPTASAMLLRREINKW